jgi:DNA replication initiation complex subunit (GINS family)
MSPPLEPLQYKDVMEIWQKEKKAMSLSEVRHDFYPSLRELVARLERDRGTETAKDPYSVLSRSLNQQLINIREKAGSIFDFRMEKIFRMAVRGASGGKVETTRMTEEERGIFEEVLGRAKGLRGDALGTVRPAHPESQRMTETRVSPGPDGQTLDEGIKQTGDMPTTAPAEAPMRPTPQAVDAMQPAPGRAPKETPSGEGLRSQSNVEKKSEPSAQTKATAGPERGDMMLLRILEDIPPIAGPNGTYKLGREDIVTLPAPMARALVKRGKAMEIVANRS